MSTREKEPLLVYQRGRDLLDQQLPKAPGPARRAAVFAGVLRALWPEAALCYCRLGEGAARALWRMTISSPSTTIGCATSRPSSVSPRANELFGAAFGLQPRNEKSSAD